MTIKDEIITLMRARKTAKLVYHEKKTDTRVNREVEPYSFGEAELFGFCISDGHIKRFKLDRIISVAEGRAFEPRREINIP